MDRQRGEVTAEESQRKGSTGRRNSRAEGSAPGKEIGQCVHLTTEQRQAQCSLLGREEHIWFGGTRNPLNKERTERLQQMANLSRDQYCSPYPIRTYFIHFEPQACPTMLLVYLHIMYTPEIDVHQLIGWGSAMSTLTPPTPTIPWRL